MPAALRELRAPRGPSNMIRDDLLVLSGEGEDSPNLDLAESSVQGDVTTRQHPTSVAFLPRWGIAAAMRRVDRRYRGAVQDVRLSDDAADGLSVVDHAFGRVIATSSSRP